MSVGKCALEFYIGRRGGAMTFEVLQSEAGTFGWRLRGADGKLVEIAPGAIMLPPVSAAKRKRFKAGTQRALEMLAARAPVKV